LVQWQSGHEQTRQGWASLGCRGRRRRRYSSPETGSG
jgi:hypothetical protein